MRAIVLGLALLAGWSSGAARASEIAQLGPRPFYLVDSMKPGPLKERLRACGSDRTYTARAFSIAHRGRTPPVSRAHAGGRAGGRPHGSRG